VSYTTSFYTIFKEMGVDVPGELSLAGVHHEIKEPDFGVTSVTYDWPAIFKTGLETLRDIVSGKIAPGKKILVAPGFYTGRTTKKISGGAL
jgi:DNA-binding LacI/PurR family transcriptional regulator